ncbi:cytochrome c biogenesis CcdA family protein [candidate division KSB1 bacterium]
MPDISIFAAFIAGVISFISPCVLPLVPAYISIMSGVSLDEIRGGESKRVKAKVLLSSISFILGFSLVFVLLGASATFIGKFLFQQQLLFRIIAGSVIIIFGLHLTGIFKIKFLLYEQRINKQSSKAGMISTFFIGMAFAFGWSPCLGPILAAILGIAATKETVGQGILLLSFYSLGLGIPFFLTALATDYFIGVFNKIKKHMRMIEIISGVFLIVIGLLIIFDFFTVIASYATKWFPFLTNIG